MSEDFPADICEQQAYLLGIPCAPPWHFCGWYESVHIPKMRLAAREVGVTLRFGEHICPSQSTESDGVDVWALAHDDVQKIWECCYAMFPVTLEDADSICP